MQAIVTSLLTTYQLQGKGKLVLILHGWGDSAQGSLALQAALSKKYQVLALDLPGFGHTQAPPEAWDLDNYATFVSAALAKLQLKQPYAIIGHSNGGALAIRAISMQLLEPKKLILLAAAGVRSGQSLRLTALKVLAKAGNLATIGLPRRYRQALRRQLYASAGSDMMVVEGLQETFKKTVRQDVQADAATIAVPTLLLYAQNDTAVPVAVGERYQALIAKSQFKIIADAGHFLQLDKPQAVLQEIEAFLA